MHLFSLALFGDRFGVDITVPDFLDAVTRASSAATQDLAARLRFGAFGAYTNRVDGFLIQRTYGPADAPYTHALLSRGLTSFADVTAYATSSPINYQNNETSQLTNLKDVNEDGRSNYLAVDGEKGLLTIHSMDLTSKWVIVHYSGGFDVATDDEYIGVPAWLSEAAMAQAALNLSRHRAFTPEEGGGDLSELKGILRRTFSENSRFSPKSAAPTYTVA